MKKIEKIKLDTTIISFVETSDLLRNKVNELIDQSKKPKDLYQTILDLSKTLGFYAYGNPRSFKESWARRITKYIEANYTKKDG